MLTFWTMMHATNCRLVRAPVAGSVVPRYLEGLAEIIDSSWAREEPLPPVLHYLKMAYHLSQEARAGLSEYHLPRELSQRLLPFQSAAVRIAAHYVNKRNGVIIGDVVGLGKTLMAAALARVLQEQG